jgi:hypothetical protein
MTIHDGWSKAVTKRNGDGVPESRSNVEIDGLTFLTGLIRIDGVHSEALAASDGTPEGVKASTAFNVREVRVAGIPVIVGRDGVTVNAQSLVPGQSVQQAADAVNQALAKNELQLRLVPAPPPQQDGAQVSVQSGGIEVIHKGTTVTPADSVYRVGFTAARASAIRTSADDALGNGTSEAAGGASGATLPLDSGTVSGSTDIGSGGTTDGAAATADGSAGSSGDTSVGDSSFGSTAVSFDTGSASGSAATGSINAATPTESAAPAVGSRRSRSAATSLNGAVGASAVSRLPPASVKYVFAVFVALLLLGACAVPLRR